MNEMGAAWVLQHNYTSILLPKFDFKDIKGVIDQMRISIKLDSDIRELRPRLNELRDKMIIELGLNETTASRIKWERHRDDFIEKVNSLEAGCRSLGSVAAKSTEDIVRINVNGDSYTGNAKNESLGSRNTFNGPVYIR
jgi:hypothetical protein